MMRRERAVAAARRNWPGAVSILLAFASVTAYWLGTAVGSNPNNVGTLNVSLIPIFQLSSATSALVGFLAVRRARRGGGGLATSVIGLALGGTLTLLWVAWIGMLIVFNPTGLGQ